MLQFVTLIYNVSGAATLLSITNIKEILCVQRRFYRVKCEDEDKFFFSGGHQDEILFVLLNQCVK